SIMEVLPEDEIMLITKHGVIIRSSVAQVRVTGRIAQGVKLVQLDEGDLVTAVARVVPDDGVAEVEAGAAADGGGTPDEAGDEEDDDA
ncbi:MAG TPA: DNA gyrase C-terminal beta-propeller domain-containing protein, partial [Gemmatimonadaceae bacterium]|nr:DNA gyrase C-terminal beta-propeller domain-containing protein [Gemmatimonadaceae bacterium]